MEVEEGFEEVEMSEAVRKKLLTNLRPINREDTRVPRQRQLRHQSTPSNYSENNNANGTEFRARKQRHRRQKLILSNDMFEDNRENVGSDEARTENHKGGTGDDHHDDDAQHGAKRERASRGPIDNGWIWTI
ncbi:hypothetical protein DM860_013275 [Cuscuta australis]|uniref:Uncharacterized protein n=1 Tax=Cuscuta australis TaxID=267555 RepID=A0A328DPX7_9ASTE|nr:hypothetical protein DM860_013275 [Cuscuta australis]